METSSTEKAPKSKSDEVDEAVVEEVVVANELSVGPVDPVDPRIADAEDELDAKLKELFVDDTVEPGATSGEDGVDIVIRASDDVGTTLGV